MKLPKFNAVTKITSKIGHWLTPPVTYLTTSDIPADTRLTRISLGIALGLLVLGLATMGASYAVKPLKKVRWLRTASSILLFAGVGWTLLLGLRYEALFPFDRRIWAYLWFIPVIGFTIYRLLQYKKTIPHHIHREKRYHHYDKYLPKPRKT